MGLGHTTQINKAVKTPNLSGIVSVAGGEKNSSMFLDNEGNLFTCGLNGFGQLELGDKNNSNTPQKVENIPPISSLPSSHYTNDFFQIVDFEGRVWSCGNNECGQLGLGDTVDRIEFEMVNDLPKLFWRGKANRTKSARNVNEQNQ